MDWAAIAAGVSVLTFILVLAGGGVLWGSLTQRVVNLSERVGIHRSELNDHLARINDLSEKQGRILEWKNGFDMGRSHRET